MTPARRPLSRIPDAVLIWLGICAVIVWAAVPAILDAMSRS